MALKILALDIEGTLVTNRGKWYPRPHLHEFLEFCFHRVERVCFFTLLSKASAKNVIEWLVEAGHAPKVALERFEYVECKRNYKDLECLNHSDLNEVMLIDDNAPNVKPGQEERCILVPGYEPERLVRRFAFSSEPGINAEGEDQVLLGLIEKIEEEL